MCACLPQLTAPSSGEALLLLSRLLIAEAAAIARAPLAAAAQACLADDKFNDNPAKRCKLSPVKEERPAAAHMHALDAYSPRGPDSSDDEEDDEDHAYNAAMRKRLLIRMIRNTPFLRDFMPPPLHTLMHPPMSQAAQAMFM